MSNLNENVITLDKEKLLPTDFNGGAVLTDDGRQTDITESAVQQALREMESVWMKHHNHYAEVLDALMTKVEAARAII